MTYADLFKDIVQELHAVNNTPTNTSFIASKSNGSIVSNCVVGIWTKAPHFF